MLLLPKRNYLKKETSHKTNQPNTQSSMLLPEHSRHQDKLLLFVLRAECLSGARDLEILWKQRGFLIPSETPIKHGQQVNDLLTSYCYSLTFWNCCHQNLSSHWVSRECPHSCFHAKAAVTESKDCGTYGWSAFCFCKNWPLPPDLCHSNVFAAWRQWAPESEKLSWVNNGWKWNKQSGYGKSKMVTWFFQAPQQTKFFTCLRPSWCI